MRVSLYVSFWNHNVVNDETWCIIKQADGNVHMIKYRKWDCICGKGTAIITTSWWEKKVWHYVFYDGNYRRKKAAWFYADGYLRCMRKVRAVSGFHDLYGTVIIFYPMLQMEPALLCPDELLQYLVWAGSGNWKGDRARGPGGDFAAASDAGESGKPWSCLSALQPLRIWDSRGFWILSEVRQPVLVWPADERGCWFYEKR